MAGDRLPGQHDNRDGEREQHRGYRRTAGVGVCGQAVLVRPCRTSAANLIPNGSAVPPLSPAAIRAAAQTIPFSATSPQQAASTAQQPAVPPGASDGRGPSARLTAHHPRNALRPVRRWSELRVCLVEVVLGADEGELDRDAEPFAGLDQVFAAAGVACAGQVGLGRRPGRHQRAFGAGERGDLTDPGQLARRQPGEHGDRRTVHEPARFRPVLGGGEGVEVGERVGDHNAGHALGPVEPGEGVGVLDQARRAAQSAPQLVHHRQIRPPRPGPQIRQRGGGVDAAEPVAPGAQHRRGQQLVPGRLDRRDVHRHGRGVQVDRLGGGAVEHPGQRPGAQQVQGEHQISDPLGVAVRRIGAGRRPQRVRPLLDDPQHVGDGGFPCPGKTLVEQVDGAAEDDFLGVADPRLADQGGEREEQRQPPGAEFLPESFGIGAGHPGQGGAQRPGVEWVDLVQAAADADDLPAEMGHEAGVVGFGVAQHQDPGAEGDGAGDQAFDEGGFAGAGLAEDEHARVGDQPGPQPGQRVEADDLAPQLVPADRGPGGGGAAARDERVQAAQLGRGRLVLRPGRDAGGAARVGNLPAPRGCQRAGVGARWRLSGYGRPGGRSPAGCGPDRPGMRCAPGEDAASRRVRVKGIGSDSLLVGCQGEVNGGGGGRVRAGRCRTGRVAVNPAAWLRYIRCSRIREDSAAASVSATARGSWAGSVTVTVTYMASRLTPAPRASSSAACRARAWSWASRAVTSRRVRREYSLRNSAARTSFSSSRAAAAAGNGRYCRVTRLGNRPGATRRARTSEWTFWRGASRHAQVTEVPLPCR